jgi:hypothetical protein
MRSLSLKTRLILSVSVILVFGFALTNIHNYRVATRSLHKNIVEHSLPLTRDNIYSEIQADLIRPVFISSLMANDTFLKDWALAGEQDVSQITRYLQEIRERYGFFSAFFVSEQTGRYYHFNGVLKQISRQDAHDVWYYDFKAMNKPYDLVVDTDEAAENSLTIFINHRLNDYDGRLLGVTGVGLNMKKVADLLKTYRQRYGRDIYLVDRDGLIKVHKDQSLVDRANIADQPGLRHIAARALRIKTDRPFLEFSRDGRRILLTSRYLPEFEWFLFVEQDETRSLAAIRQAFFSNMAFNLLVIVLSEQAGGDGHHRQADRRLQPARTRPAFRCGRLPLQAPGRAVFRHPVRYRRFQGHQRRGGPHGRRPCAAGDHPPCRWDNPATGRPGALGRRRVCPADSQRSGPCRPGRAEVAGRTRQAGYADRFSRPLRQRDHQLRGGRLCKRRNPGLSHDARGRRPVRSQKTGQKPRRDPCRRRRRAGVRPPLKTVLREAAAACPHKQA